MSLLRLKFFILYCPKGRWPIPIQYPCAGLNCVNDVPLLLFKSVATYSTFSRGNLHIYYRAVKKFLSSRLIMNSRWLWNLHQRHKCLRPEPSIIGTFWKLESWKWRFQRLSQGICLVRINTRLGTMPSKCPKRIAQFERFTDLNLLEYLKTGKRILNNFIRWCLFFVSSYGRGRWK